MSTILLRRVRVQENGHYIFTARSASVNASIVFTVHVYRKSISLIENQRSHKWMKPMFDHIFFPNIQRSLILKLSGKMGLPLVWRLVILYPGSSGSIVKKIQKLCMSSLLYNVVCSQEICEDFLTLIWLGDRCRYINTSSVGLKANQSTLGADREYEPQQVKSVLPVTNTKTNSTFECVATNTAGEDRDTYRISCKKNDNIPAIKHHFVHLK